ncbi:hypothetical protein DFQ27_006357 [Actinomortierella ambigua]|uniref:Uncharacterized protein n=1 Tax=Actinomortierella ambigua TaxID=1343610 RepID=A0A9P6QI39_9FUNG|nr:hypothetical protein DFQ27_006357 [Actinomortierella ambigua]
MDRERIRQQVLQLPIVKEYLAKFLRIASDFRQLTIEWNDCIDQGAEALRSARISPVRAVASLDAVINQLQAILEKMTQTHDSYLVTLQRPPTLPPSIVLPSSSSSSSPSSAFPNVSILADLQMPGTQTSALALFAEYMDPTWLQYLDEFSFKSSGVLPSLETIAALKDSGADDLPPLLESQLTNLVLLWELEPYRDGKEDVKARESRLGVVDWKMAK